MKKGFCVLGIIVSLVVSLFGVLLLSGALTDSPSSASGASYLYSSGYASFGADFYTYVSNNAAEAASAARTVADNQRDIFTLIRTASGIFVTGFGLLGFCLFGALMKKTETDPTVVPMEPANKEEREKSNTVPQENVKAETKAKEIADEIRKQMGVEDAAASTLPPKKPIGIEAKTLPEMLTYAAKFTSDSGMTCYLKREKDKLPEEDRIKVEGLLLLSPNEMREAIKKMV
jgi:hypothetical protein